MTQRSREYYRGQADAYHRGMGQTLGQLHAIKAEAERCSNGDDYDLGYMHKLNELIRMTEDPDA